jgi:multiple sugar transport system substrate-binding protein
MTKTRSLLLTTAIALIILLANCRPGEATSTSRETADDGEIIQLVYQDWRTDWFPGMAQEMLDQFHALHPNIRVFYTPDPEDVPGEMPAIFEAGTAPDIVNGCCDFFPAWAQAGYLLDLRPFVERDIAPELIAEWDSAQYESFFTAGGVQYALPKYHGALVVYYNKDMFDRHGVAYPTDDWTYDDYLEAMTALTLGDGETDVQVWGSTFDPIYDRVQIHVNSFGGHYANPDDPTDCVLDEPEAVAALEWLRVRMWDDRVMATTLALNRLETRQAFWDGRVAMVEDGSWALKDILANADFRVGFAPFPAGPARHATLSTTDGFAISATTEHPEEAWELLKFLISQEYSLAMAEANFLQPSRLTLVEEWADFVRAEFPEESRELDLAAFADGQLEGYSVTAEVFANMQGVRTATDAAFEDILTLGLAPAQERLNQACEEIESLQK